MELHHLHVAQRQPSAQRHREPVHALVAGGRVIAVHGRPAAGREQHGLRRDVDEAAGADVDHQHAGDRRAVLGADQRDRAMLLEPADAGPRPHLLHQPVDDLDAGEVALVHGAVEGLAGEGLAVQRAVRIAVEEAADLVLELGDALDRLRHQRPGEFLMRQPLAALDRVHEMALDRVAAMQRDVVAALHHAGAAAFAEQALGRDRDVERRRSAACACSAANSPAPPLPRMRMSVSRRSIVHSEHAREKQECRRWPRPRWPSKREPRLSVAPREVFQQQQPQPAEHVHGEQADEHGLGQLHQRLIGPAQEALQPRLARDREPEREEMKRQEDREREPGEAMDQRRDPERTCAMRQRGVMAAPPRRPRGTRARPAAVRTGSRQMWRHERAAAVHSASTVRTPIEA